MSEVDVGGVNEFVKVNVKHADIVTFFKKMANNGSADATGAAGDDDVLGHCA